MSTTTTAVFAGVLEVVDAAVAVAVAAAVVGSSRRRIRLTGADLGS